MGISSIAAAGAGGSSPISGADALKQAPGALAEAEACRGKDTSGKHGIGNASTHSWYNKNSEMNTSSFVTLTQKMSSANKTGGIMDPKELAGIVAALKILEKVVELVGEILDNLIGDGEK